MSSGEFVPLESLGEEQLGRLSDALSRVLEHFEGDKQQEAKEEEEDLYAGGPYSDLSRADVSAILAQYPALDGHRSLVGFRALAGGLSNSNFRVDVEFHPEDPRPSTYLLKVWDEKTVEELRVQLDVLKVLRAADFPTCYPAATRDGGDELLVYKQMPVTLLDWIDGDGGGPAKATPRVMAEVGAVVAKLHTIQGVPEALGEFPMGIIQMKPFLDDEVKRAAEAVQADPFVAFLRDGIARFEKAVDGVDLGPDRILHGDVFLENTIFRGGRLLALIDFEETCRGPAVLDVAMTVCGCCFDKQTNTLNDELKRAFLGAYERVRPLSDAETAVFDEFLRYSCLSIAFWRFRQFNCRKFDEKRRQAHQEMVDRYNSVTS